MKTELNYTFTNDLKRIFFSKNVHSYRHSHFKHTLSPDMFFDLKIRKNNNILSIREGFKLDLREHNFDKLVPTRESLSSGP